MFAIENALSSENCIKGSVEIEGIGIHLEKVQKIG